MFAVVITTRDFFSRGAADGARDGFMNKLKIFMVASAATMLSSCDLSQIPGLDGKLSIEDSKAIGAACRHSGRALEDCFALNPKSHHAGVFEGWREMNDYMVANEIETVKPEIQPSAFKQAENPKHGESGHANAAGGANKEAASGGDAPAGSSRQRWAPRGQGDSTTAPATTPAPAVAAAPEPPAPPTAKAPVVDEPKAETKPDGKSRPWERKKDPKNHT